MFFHFVKKLLVAYLMVRWRCLVSPYLQVAVASAGDVIVLENSQDI